MSSSRSFLFYCGLLLVTTCSVVFGLDWVSAPLPPMPETEASVQAAKLAANIPPPRAPRVAQVRSVYPARPLPQVADATPGAPVIVQPAAPVPVARAPEETAAPKCDVAACGAAYRSFRAADCSWQPFDGPRRFCDKGTPQTQAAAEPEAGTSPIAATETGADAPKCNVEACRQAYFTFTPADCTYQPSGGPRKLCTK